MEAYIMGLFEFYPGILVGALAVIALFAIFEL